MNILVFTTLWPNVEQPNFGVFVKNRTAALAQLDDVNVRVVAPAPYFPRHLQSPFIPAHWRQTARIPDHELIAEIETFHPRHLVTPKVGMTFYSRWMARGSRELVERLHAGQPIDLIDAHYVYPDGHAAVLLGERLGIPVIVTARGTDINLFSRMPLIRPMIQQALTRAAGVIAVSGALKERIVELGIEPDKVAVIRNGIDPSIFYLREREERREVRRKLGLDGESQIIITVGALVPLKGIDRLIDAMARLNHGRAKLYVIGEGPERGALAKRIAQHHLAERVFLIGSRPQSELSEWYAAADLFCLASSREGCPNVVIEAMACGTPVVAADVGGVRELVSDPGYGRIVPAPAPENFAAEIKIALASQWNHADIARQGGASSWNEVARKVDKLMRGIAGQRA
jgi:glycosyltransferase involved in cell wall biosynthesis